MIQGLCYQQAEPIINVKLGNTDADSYKFEPMAELLAWWKKINKDKHGKHCHYQEIYCSLFVISVNEILGREALVLLKNLTRLMAKKMNEPILHVQV